MRGNPRCAVHLFSIPRLRFRSRPSQNRGYMSTAQSSRNSHQHTRIIVSGRACSCRGTARNGSASSISTTSAMWQSGPGDLPGFRSLLTTRLAAISLALADTFVHILPKDKSGLQRALALAVTSCRYCDTGTHTGLAVDHRRADDVAGARHQGDVLCGEA